VQWLNRQHVLVHPETPVRTYLKDISQDETTLDLLEAALFPLTGADPEMLSTHMLWAEIGFHNHSIDDTLNAPTCRIAEGCDALAKALAQQLGDNISYESVVSHISHQKNNYAVQTKDTIYHAKHCIAALPLMTLQNNSFDPPLAKDLQAIALNANAGRVAKAWALVESDTPLAETFHASSPLRYGYVRPLTEGKFKVCGQILNNGNGPITTADATALMEANWPGVRVIETAVVDWTHEPLAKASWHSGRAGWAGKTAAFRHPLGNLHFAGGDIAETWAGWMEGALLSGQDVARRIITASGH
jgi:monoamine oxidase